MSEQTHQRLHLAKEELDVALELFIAGRSYVSALIIAGAAEDVLSKILSARGVKPAIEQQHSVISPVETFLRGRSTVWKDFVAEKARTHAAALNVQERGQATLSADLEDAALWMLVRAYDNYKRLGLQATPKVAEFDRWLSSNLGGRAG
jgi:hypothetical protein